MERAGAESEKSASGSAGVGLRRGFEFGFGFKYGEGDAAEVVRRRLGLGVGLLVVRLGWKGLSGFGGPEGGLRVRELAVDVSVVVVLPEERRREGGFAVTASGPEKSNKLGPLFRPAVIILGDEGGVAGSLRISLYFLRAAAETDSP